MGAGLKQLDSEYKLKQNIRIAMLYLEDEDHVNAEMFIKKASALISSCKVRPRDRLAWSGEKERKRNTDVSYIIICDGSAHD